MNANYRKKQRSGDAMKIVADTIEDINFEANKFLGTPLLNEKVEETRKKVISGWDKYYIRCFIFVMMF